MLRFAALGTFVLLATLHTTLTAVAQPKPLPPVPQFPTLTTPLSLGATVGQTAELTLTGSQLSLANGVVTNIPNCAASIVAGSAKTDRVAVKLPIAKDTPIGLYTLRVMTPSGATNQRTLCIDELPEIEEKPGNNKKDTAMKLAGPSVVTGTVTAETSDFFRMSVSPGQRLTFEVLARRIGSPLDPVIILHDAKTGREMPALYADDTPGLQSDARLSYTFKSAADVIVELRDSTYRGGGDYGYRLRIGDFPSAMTAFPLAMNEPNAIGFAGPNTQGLKPAKPSIVGVSPRGGAVAGWPVSVIAAIAPQSVEQEPNNDVKTANALPVPGGVSALFATKGDIDFFKFPAKKDKKLEVIAQTYAINSPCEVLLRVQDAKGAEVAKSDPSKATARVEFTATADGEYFVVAEQLNFLHGPIEVYHLSVQPVLADFEIQLGSDRVEVPVGGTGLLAVVGLTKINGWNAPIELSVVSDSLSGSVTLPAAANPQAATPIILPITAKPSAKPGINSFTIKASAKRDGTEYTKSASLSDQVRASLGGLANLPNGFSDTLHAVVVERPLFTLSAKGAKIEVPKGGTVKVQFTSRRAIGFGEEIALALTNLPANVTAKVAPIAKGKNVVEFELTAAANAAVGTTTLYPRGSAKVNGREFAYHAAALPLTIIEPKKDEPKKKEEPKKK